LSRKKAQTLVATIHIGSIRSQHSFKDSWKKAAGTVPLLFAFCLDHAFLKAKFF
jgi:hypothetical protein